MEKIEIELTNGKLIPTIITSEELIYGVTTIAVGMKNDYIDVSSNVGRIKNILSPLSPWRPTYRTGKVSKAH